MERGANVNARCRPDADCVGNQTPLFHIVNHNPNPGGDLKQSAIPNPSDMFLSWDGHIRIWTIGGGWNSLKNMPPNIEEGNPHYDTTYRHVETIRLEDGTLAKVEKKGPNALLADGHVETRISFAGPWSDDNFNLPAN